MNVDISKLSNWNKNPRGIKKDDFERLKSQIKELGLYKPFLVDITSNIVLGGNMRLKACLELGIKEVPVNYVDAPTDELKIKYALSDNDRAGYYEEDQLAELILSVPDIELSNYKLDLGQLTSVADLLNRFAPDPEEDEAPEVSDEPPISKLGEVYQLGRHRLMCGDSTKIEDVEKLMDGKKADMVFTDPPYGISLGFETPEQAKSRNRRTDGKKVQNDDLQGDDLIKLLTDANTNMDMFLKEGGAFYLCSPIDKEVRKFIESIETVGWHYQSGLVWNKSSMSLSRHDYHPKHEIIHYGWKLGKAHKWTTDRKQTSVFDYDKPSRSEDHPTTKPVGLVSYFVGNVSDKDDIVMDLFLGSGSTLIACEQTNRTCYGMELDPKYCDVIRKRYWKFIDPENWETKWQM